MTRDMWSDKNEVSGGERTNVRTLVDYDCELGINDGPLEWVRVPAGSKARVDRVDAENRLIDVTFTPEVNGILWGKFGWDEVEIVADHNA